MKRTIMTYTIATIVSLAAIGGLIFQPSYQMAHAQTVPPTGPVTTNPVCGEKVSGVVTLTSNLECNGDGIIVGADNTVINLNGFSIKNTAGGTSNNKVGIMVPMYDNVMINGPGTVSNFQAGVLATGASHLGVSTGVILLGNEIGVFMTGADHAQLAADMFMNNNIGFATHSISDLSLKNGLFTNNKLAGITTVNTHGTTLDTNTVQGSDNGIFLDSQSDNNKVLDNNLHGNKIDINNANGLPANINSNQFSGNNCDVSNPSGICIGK